MEVTICIFQYMQNCSDWKNISVRFKNLGSREENQEEIELLYSLIASLHNVFLSLFSTCLIIYFYCQWEGKDIRI